MLGPAHPNGGHESEVALAGMRGATRAGPTRRCARGLRGQRIAREHALLTLASLPERQALEYARRPGRKASTSRCSFATTPADREAVLDEVIRGRALTLDEMSLRRRAAADGRERRNEGVVGPPALGAATARQSRGAGAHRAIRAGTRCSSTRRDARRKRPSGRSPNAAPRSARTRDGRPPALTDVRAALPARHGARVVLPLRPDGRHYHRR